MAQIKKSTLLFGVVVLAGLVGAVKWLMPSKDDQSGKSMTTNEAAPTAAPAGADNIPVTGTTKEAKAVTVKTSYKNPAGDDEVGFTLYVDSTSMIVDAKTEILAIHDISKKRQTAFADGLPMAVKGKKLSELTAIDKVGGSSLTTKAFNDALTQLKAQI